MTENKAQPEKLALRLQDIAGVKQQELLRLFPEVRDAWPGYGLRKIRKLWSVGQYRARPAK